MTVAELITTLWDYPWDAEVYVPNGDGEFRRIAEVKPDDNYNEDILIMGGNEE